MDRSHEAKIQPFLLRSDRESAKSPAQRGGRKEAKLQKAGRAITQLLRAQFSGSACSWSLGGRQGGQKYLSDKVHGAFSAQGTRHKDFILLPLFQAFLLRLCLIQREWNLQRAWYYWAVWRNSVFTGSLKTDTDLFIAEEIWKFPEDLHMPVLSSHSLNLSRIQMLGI